MKKTFEIYDYLKTLGYDDREEQLQKDIATLNSILNWNVPSIIAKGRTHYICKKRVTDLELLQELDENPSKIDRMWNILMFLHMIVENIIRIIYQMRLEKL